MKILITGSNIKAFQTARFIKAQNPDFDIYVTTQETCPLQTYTPINIEENDINEIKNFVKFNQIDFTVCMSGYSVINGLADIFEKENFPVFAPKAEAARITFSTSIAKKIMYKLKINTPRFGIFDRENIALDYLRNAKFPVDILNDFTLIERKRNTYKSFIKAKEAIQKIYENNNEKIIIENYTDSKPIKIYFITDGFNALPLICLEENKSEFYSEIHAPSSKISEETLINIMRNTLYPLLDDIAKYTNTYIGILGLKIKQENNNYQVLEFYNNFEDYDFQAFLSLLEENMCMLMYNTTNGALVDNYNYIKLFDKYSYTLVLDKSKIKKVETIFEDTEEDIFVSEDNKNIIITSSKATLSRAKNTILDIINPICETETYKQLLREELRV